MLVFARHREAPRGQSAELRNGMDKSGLFCGYEHKEQNFDSRELFSSVDKDIRRSKA